MKKVNKQESGKGRANRMRGALNLAHSPQFGREYGPYGPNGQPAGYYSYTHLGHEVRLRFSQDTYEWGAWCPYFDIRISFPHQPPQDIQQILNDWLNDQEAHLALEIYEERGF